MSVLKTMKTESPDGADTPDGHWRQAGDAELIAAVSACSEAAFYTLYLRYHERLRQFIVRVTRRPDVAEEVLNDTFMVIWQKAGRFGGRSTVSTWVFGIAYRKCLKAMERADRWQSRYRPIDDQYDTLHGDSRPDEETGRAQLRRRVHQCLTDLSPEQRMAFEMTHFFGYSYPEIAAVAQCSVNTVKTRMFHARRKLRAALEHDR